MAIESVHNHAAELGADRQSTTVYTAVDLREGELASRAPADVVRQSDTAEPAIVKAQRPDLRPSDTLNDAVAKILAANARQVLGNLYAAEIGCDSEAVHQLRVGIRRLRSTLSLFRKYLRPSTRTLSAQAGIAFRQLSLARDLDVFLLETLPRVVRTAAATNDLGPITAAACARRDVAYDDVRLLLRSGVFNQMLSELMRRADGGVLETEYQDAPLRPTASRLLRKRHRKLLKAGEDFDRLAAAQRHVVRIKLKRLRYACDSFQGIYPEGIAMRYLRKQSSLQDLFGRLNDMTVAAAIAQDLAKRVPRASSGADAVSAWRLHQIKVIQPRLDEAWYDFTRLVPFWQD